MRIADAARRGKESADAADARMSRLAKLFVGAHVVRRILRGHTIGVRGVVVDDDKLLLVRHSYLPGWFFPGGGVEPGETALEGLNRELDEETGIQAEGVPILAGIFLNRKLAARDHVLLFRVPRYRRLREFRPNLEIREAKFFALDSLPDDLSKGTSRRVDELFRGAAASADW